MKKSRPDPISKAKKPAARARRESAALLAPLSVPKPKPPQRPAARPLSAEAKKARPSGFPPVAARPRAAQQRGNEKTCEAVITRVVGSFGFARPKDAEADLFIPGRYLGGAAQGDTVLLRLLPPREGDTAHPEPIGAVERILVEQNRPFAGFLIEEEGVRYVLPDGGGCRYRLLEGESTGAPGDKVLCELALRSEDAREHRARVLQSYGSAESAGNCARAVLDAAGIPQSFPQDVLDEAARLEKAGISARERENRLDLRARCIFTIDGAESKDLDDAVSVERLPGGGWELGVHIADVSHYVTTGSALDEEAYRRGTSVYYADRVVPMLPPALSNGICSLNPAEDRLAFSALMQFSPEGELLGWSLYKSIIRSRIKGVYEEINRYWRTGDETVAARYAEVLPALAELRELANVLKSAKYRRGALQLSSSEAKIIIAPDGSVADVRRRTGGEAEEMIEVFMLAANEAVAREGARLRVPLLYRIHEKPTPKKVEELLLLLGALGIEWTPKGAIPTQHELGRLLERTSTDRRLGGVVANAVLRSMAKARYNPTDDGHFGLSLLHYCQFTSPIRRYPDLFIHRVLTRACKGEELNAVRDAFKEEVEQFAVDTSATEQRAVTAERDCEACYKAEYMKAHLGEIYEAVITGITPRGFFVELPNTVEGMVTLESLGGDYSFDGRSAYTPVGGTGGYRLGDRVKVLCIASDVVRGRVDFLLQE